MRKNKYKKWSDAEIGFIKDNCDSMKDSDIAVYLSKITGDNTISVAMVRRQRRKLNIQKTRGRRVNSRLKDC